ncbi:MAG: RNA polymerase sigma factor [Betaproteobacteria bacterium]|nr:RNA polymerase sigma factor [Betaproteobacteria bacterium]
MTVLERHAPLLEPARLGDRAALESLLRACQPDVRRYAYRHCLMSDVDDAVQETLLIVARRIQSLRAIAAFSGWLFQIVRRECRRLERRVFGLDSFDEEKMEGWLAVHSDDAVRLDLIGGLESLSMHHREAILLRDFEELTIRELAERLRLSIPATKSRLRRARELMREYLLA